jgi:hypothetical protein
VEDVNVLLNQKYFKQLSENGVGHCLKALVELLFGCVPKEVNDRAREHQE